jgi:hypothetical protein
LLRCPAPRAYTLRLASSTSRSLRLSKARRPQMRAAAPQLAWNV